MRTGTQAKLEPPEGGTVADGLEVKVAFNGVWKESLTELSGGQRSLLALSLILGLLLFKPAPMYVYVYIIHVILYRVCTLYIISRCIHTAIYSYMCLLTNIHQSYNTSYIHVSRYILDEVDAALDLSHTQNIGTMLRTHFSTSQFIVVSLKEGMFNNANVIFRTRFVDGVSAVTRTVVGKNRVPAGGAGNGTGTANLLQREGAEEEENESNEAPKRKKGKVLTSSATTSNTTSGGGARSRVIDFDA